METFILFIERKAELWFVSSILKQVNEIIAEFYCRRFLYCETKIKQIVQFGKLKIWNNLWENTFLLQLAEMKMQKNNYEVVQVQWMTIFLIGHPPFCTLCTTGLRFEWVLALTFTVLDWITLLEIGWSCRSSFVEIKFFRNQQTFWPVSATKLRWRDVTEGQHLQYCRKNMLSWDHFILC